VKINELLQEKMSFSFEVFPPKEDKPIEPLVEIIRKLSVFKPDFISCTYGAGGTNKGRSLEVCEAIVKSQNEAMTHFTCIGNTEQEIVDELSQYTAMGIENILALRGDLPAGWSGTKGDFAYANQLIRFIKEKFPQACIAAACYPEMHIEESNFETDLAYLKIKQESGAQVLMTQLCHDVEAYKRFLGMLEKAKINLPVILGLMPVLSKESILKMTLVTGCSVPRDLSALIGKYGDNPEDFKKAGKEYTVNQILRYISAGIDGLHIYVLNKYDDVADILEIANIR